MTFGPSLFTMAASNVIISKVISLFTYFNYNHLGEMMPMLPYPPTTKPDAAENSLLRVLGGVLAFLSILLTLLGIILHQRVADLILAIIVGLFALRVFLLWLGDKPQHQRPIPGRPSMGWVRYPMQSPPYTPGQPAPHAPPYFQSQPLDRLAPEQHGQHIVPMPPAAAAPPPLTLPRSVRPQQSPKAPAFPAQPAPLPQGVQPMPSSLPPSPWLPPSYAFVPMPSPAPLAGPPQQENWQYDDEEPFTQQQRGNDHGTA